MDESRNSGESVPGKSIEMIEFRDATGYSAQDFAATMTQCFEDYVIPITFNAPLAAFLWRAEAVDLVATIVATEGDAPAGVLMVARRGETMRVAAMAVAKPYRGRGLGHQMMERALEGGRARGERFAVLEAIEHNTGAIRFYEDCGFRTRFRLISAEGRLSVSAEGPDLESSTFPAIAFSLLERGDGAWSWDMSPGSVMQFANPIVPLEHRGMKIAVQPIGEDGLLCRALARSGNDDEAKLSEVLRGLAIRFPERTFRIPPYFPEPEFGELLTSAGLTLGSLNQVQMERTL